MIRIIIFQLSFLANILLLIGVNHNLLVSDHSLALPDLVDKLSGVILLEDGVAVLLNLLSKMRLVKKMKRKMNQRAYEQINLKSHVECLGFIERVLLDHFPRVEGKLGDDPSRGVDHHFFVESK